jgi:hypothetical protein
MELGPSPTIKTDYQLNVGFNDICDYDDFSL